MTDLRFADVFAGCGGLSLGFVSHGFTSVMAVESNEDAAETYALNIDPRVEIRAIFVTSNSLLVRVGRVAFAPETPGTWWPVAILDDDLGTMLWLKAPTATPDFPQRQLIADAYAAMEPRTTLWGQYLDEIDRLSKSGDISADEFFLLRYAVESKHILMDVTRGDPARLSPNAVRDVLALSEKRYSVLCKTP